MTVSCSLNNENSDCNFFDYKIRASLKQRCKGLKVKLSYQSSEHDVLIDVITLVSDGDNENAVRNLQETVNFMANYRTSINRLNDPSTVTEDAVLQKWDMESDLEDLYWNLIYRFWKTYLIKVLVSHRRKIKPKYKPYESLRRSQFFVNHTSTIGQFLFASKKEERRLFKIQQDLDAEYKGNAAVIEDKILRSDVEFE